VSDDGVCEIIGIGVAHCGQFWESIQIALVVFCVKNHERDALIQRRQFDSILSAQVWTDDCMMVSDSDAIRLDWRYSVLSQVNANNE